MKKIVFAIMATVSLGLGVQAQFRIGIKGGLNRVSQRVNSSGTESIYSNDHFKTFHAGIITDVPLSECFSVQGEGLYTQKGSTHLSATGAADASIRIKAIEMPISIVYKLPVSFGKLFGGVGGGFSYALSGQQTQNGQKLNLYKDLSAWRREDINFHFSAGIEFSNGLFVSIRSQKSLVDAYKPEGVSVKNHSTALSLGYLIDWNAHKKKG